MRQALILIVDDDPDVQEMLVGILRDEGYRVTSAFNGKEGLTRVSQEVPSLILLDLMMPVMDGWEFGRALHQLYPDCCVPVIVLSANERGHDHAHTIGAAGHVPKPFDLDHLLRVLTCHLPAT